MRDVTWNVRAYAIYQGLGNLNEALACCNRALEVNQNFVRVWFTKGCILAQLGRAQEAIASFKRYIELAPPEYASLVEHVKGAIRQLQVEL